MIEILGGWDTAKGVRTHMATGIDGRDGASVASASGAPVPNCVNWRSRVRNVFPRVISWCDCENSKEI
jgi:hypothetical protein